MKFLTGIILTFILASTANSQSVNLQHLSKEEFKNQMETCSDSIFQSLGIKNPEATYYDNTYDWLINTINKIIDKNPQLEITHETKSESDLNYHICWYREYDNVNFNISFILNKKYIGNTKFLYGLIKENSIFTVKINKCKKIIENILRQRGRPLTVFISDQNGCKTINPNPIKNETITWSGDCLEGYSNGVGTLEWYIKRKKTEFYTGSMIKGKPEGQGTYHFSDEYIHKGEFKNGQLIKGDILEKTDNYIYVSQGQFHNEKLYGHGKIKIYESLSDYKTEKVGRTIIGENWKNGHLQHGTMILSDSSIYEGDIVDLKAQGFGKNIFPNGNIYEGEFYNDDLGGKGIVTFPNQVKYKGTWVNGLLSGKGEIIYPDGTINVGIWENGILVEEIK